MITLDAAQMAAREEAHTYLQEMLSLPQYYGRNLDALYDCLTDLDDTEIVFLNAEECSPYCERILNTFLDAALDNPRLTLRGISPD